MSMSEPTPARLYLVTPAKFDPAGFAEDLKRLVATIPVACIRLDLGTETDEDAWRRAANHLLPVCHDADIALVIAEHYRLVRPLGLDGVHLRKGSTPVRSVRKELGADAIVGGEAGASRHAGMTLAEAGADYVSIGPVAVHGELGDGEIADDEVFAWWADVIETPCVAEGGVGVDEVRRLAATTDFVVPDIALWSDPAAMITTLREMTEILAED
ncbi:thiamine phosphate synthase [Rhodobacteraceae bacterium NNCM2]|nr:thiamine phosphate synthase [Coraliihabitans acroporae]